MREFREFLYRCVLFTLTVAGLQAAPPNFLVIITDDHRADSIGVFNKAVATPNIDQLIRSGTAFTQARILGAQQGAVCVPSRAMLMSGRSLFRVAENLKDVETWPMKLNAAGYKTFAAGKWHNGRESFPASFSEGESIFLGGMSDQFKVKVADYKENSWTNERVETRYTAEVFADAAVKFLRGRASSPFCLYVAFTTPHDPRNAPAEFRARYNPDSLTTPPNFLPRHPFDNGEMEVRDEKLLPWPRTPEAVRRELADYYAAITATDAQIGRILNELKSKGLAENTVVIFAGDNGLAIGSHGLLGKQNLYEHSMRVPLAIAGPGIPAGKRSPALVVLSDLAPTICELAKVPAPIGSEGRSLLPILRGGRVQFRANVLTAYRDVQRAVTDGRWKLITYPKIGRTQMFDLRRDPNELHDLADDPKRAATRQGLETLLRQEQKAAGDPLAIK